MNRDARCHCRCHEKVVAMGGRVVLTCTPEAPYYVHPVAALEACTLCTGMHMIVRLEHEGLHTVPEPALARRREA